VAINISVAGTLDQQLHEPFRGASNTGCYTSRLPVSTSSGRFRRPNDSKMDQNIGKIGFFAKFTRQFRSIGAAKCQKISRHLPLLAKFVRHICPMFGLLNV
jgi:hypothetical protein